MPANLVKYLTITSYTTVTVLEPIVSDLSCSSTVVLYYLTVFMNQVDQAASKDVFYNTSIPEAQTMACSDSDVLGIPGILETAENLPDGCASICSFCSRMKRGRIYAAARREGYNVLALGQHLDDLAERYY